LEAPSRRGSVDLEAALARVAKASRPIVITGALSLRRGWREILGRLRIPVFTTAAAKGAIDETLPHACGVYTGVGKHLTAEALLLPQADMVLGIGLRADEVLRPGFGATTALLIDEVDMAYSGSAAEGRILADEAATEAILGGLQRCEWGLEAIAGIKARQRQVLLGERWLPAAAFEVLNTALSFPYAMVMDTGQFCTIGEHCWLASPDRPYLGASNSRGMGAGLPSAIGLAISETPRPVICVVGDGGMPAYPGELRLAVEQALPLCVILMTDGCFGSIVNAPIDQVQSSRRAVSVPGSSWWRIASAMGCEAHQVASSEALAEVLTDWRRASPLFIEATFPQASYAVMARDLR
jgi:acetolactate synthase-1/2/3 large subunit